MAVFSFGYEGRLANFYPRLSQKKEDSALPAALSLPAVSGADERGPMAGARGTSVVDTVGDGLAQVAGESRPCWRLLNLLALTEAFKRVARSLARFFVNHPRTAGLLQAPVQRRKCTP